MTMMISSRSFLVRMPMVSLPETVYEDSYKMVTDEA